MQNERKNLWEERGSERISQALELKDAMYYNLMRAGIVTIRQLGSMTEWDLSRITIGTGRYYFGKKSIAYVQNALVNAGFPKLPKY